MRHLISHLFQSLLIDGLKFFRILLQSTNFKRMRWIRPVTEEGRAGLRDYQGK